MRLTTTLSAIALIGFSFLAQAADTSTTAHLDATGGNAGDHQIVYVANANSANTTVGTAIMVLTKSGKQEVAYGLYMDGETDRCDLVDAKLVASLSKEDDAKATVVTVDITAEHYAAAKALIKTYSDKKETLDPPADVALNCATDVLNACGLKPSYRSALRAANPVEWFQDIPRTNRKLIVE
jgi:hypothetical protein